MSRIIKGGFFMAEQEPVHHYKIRIRRPRLTPEAQNSTDTMAQQGRGRSIPTCWAAIPAQRRTILSRSRTRTNL